MTTPHKSFEERVDEVLKEHIQIVGDGWWHPIYGLDELKAALLAAHKEEVERLTDWGSWLKDRCDLHDKYTPACCGCQKANHALATIEDYKEWLRAEQRTRANLTGKEI